MRTAKAVSCGLVFVLSTKPDQALKIKKTGQTRPGKEANMDEILDQTAGEVTANEDAFLEDWGGGAEMTADQPEETAEPMETGEETPVEDLSESAETPDEGTEPPADAEQAALTQQTEAETVDARPQTWELRHMGEVRQANEAEMVALAQKGMDYDRIRSQYDEFKPVMEMVNRFANQQGLNTKEYISMLRAQAKQAEGLSEADARRSVELEDREAVVAAAEAERQAQQDAMAQAQRAEAEAASRRQADIQEFQQTFPEAAKDPNSIPPQVWADVRNGSSLVAAYARFNNGRLEQEIADAKRETASVQQNQRNAERSTGSMRSAGDCSKTRDDFGDAFDSAM